MRYSLNIVDGQGDLSLSYITNTIYACLLADVTELSGISICATPGDIGADWALIEGPKLDKIMLKYLEDGVNPPVFPEWLLPLWESFLLARDGNVLRYIRQILLFCYKIEKLPTNEQLIKAQEAFEDTDQNIGTWESSFESRSRDPLFRTARQIVGRTICKIDWSTIVPSHGPGAVYPRKNPCEKGNFNTVYSSIELHYPYYGCYVLLPSLWQNRHKHLDKELESRDTIECSLVAVPKDSRGPRLICVHPAEAIWVQQGLRRNLERAIESPCSPCHGRITFRDQGTNGKIALSSSITREYCTLDLKEASDRISPKLVEFLFGTYAYDKLSCCRATRVKLLDNRVIELKKWAPMGNCLTFPVQSLLFFSLVVSGIRCRYGVNCNDVYVFGDDIIFPSVYYDGALNALVRAGLIPNTDKTFRRGFFRESCGVDAFNGIDVTPHRLKRIDVTTNTGALSVCSIAKAMKLDGYRLTSDALYGVVSETFGLLPISNNPDGQGIYRYEPGFVNMFKYEKSLRFNGDLHKWQSRALLVSGETVLPPVGAWWPLQESLLRLEIGAPIKYTWDDEIDLATAMDRGLVYGVPHSTRLKRGWIDAV